jgi:hypothetical protein
MQERAGVQRGLMMALTTLINLLANVQLRRDGALGQTKSFAQCIENSTSRHWPSVP